MVQNSKKLGVGSLSIAFFGLSVLWSVTKDDICLGDIALRSIGLCAWSNGTSGTHYTIFYTVGFLVPALILAARHREDRFAKAVGVLSIAYLIVIGILLIAYLAANH